MRGQRHIKANPGLLAKVEKEFAIFRGTRSGSRQRCTDELRGLAFDAIDDGHAVEVVSQAAGICTSAIRRWLKERPGAAQPKLRELKIVPAAPREAAAMSKKPEHIAVRVGNQITIDVPMTALTVEFIRMLASAGAVP